MKKYLLNTAFFGMLLAAFSSCDMKKETTEFPDWAWTNFQRPAGVNPIISPDATTKFFCPMRGDSVAWEESDTFNPAATVYDGKVVVVYRAEDNSAVGIGARTSRLGYASSEDGLHFERMTVPVFYPGEDSQKELENPGGCEDPRIAMTQDGLYVMLYTQWNRKQARLAVATSRDLQTWEKHGPAFAKAYDGRFYDEFSKSASIVTKLVGGKQVIAPIGGKYYMYWGEKFVNVATSEDLINWTPMLDENGEFLKVITPRQGKFDSELTECGPPAIMTEQGILLLYNGKNKAGAEGDTLYTANSYCAGQALFDLEDPTKLIGQLDKPFFVPEAEFEKSGQYPAGTVFIEGLVYHNDKWFLYYGCADSRVAVAVLEQPANKALATSGNPLFPGWYADPEGIVFGDEYWIYPTHSVNYDDQLYMDAFSSKDLVTWTKHPKVLSKENISWLRRALWAPSVIEANGKYYIFFGANDIQSNDELGGIGVAVADNPAGPFKDVLGRPLIDKFVNGAQPIDQFVFKDDDGQYYMYYGGWGHCNIVKLAPDLLSIVPFEDGTLYKEVTPNNYTEGPFMLKRDGKYYFMWSEGAWTGHDYCVAYAIADSPFGPFERVGKILERDDSIGTGAGHHSIVKGPGAEEWYIIYHRHPLNETEGNARVTCIDRMYFNEEGKIEPVKMTFDGVKASPLKTKD